jgi:hypothetical protein
MWMSKKKKKEQEEFLSYFNVEVDEKGTSMVADIKNEDIKRWLYAVTRGIQAAFGRDARIKNYMRGIFNIGGQQIEFCFLKNGGKGPHDLRMESLKRIEELEKQVKDLEEKLAAK